MARPEDMWQCQTVNCGYIYNPDKGDRKGKIPKGTKFEDLPDEWRCPICGGTKKCFRPLVGPGSTKAPDCELPTTEKNMAPPAEETGMDKYVCNICGYVYDPEVGDPEADIPAGTSFSSLPDDWVCPVCGAGKDEFSKE